MCKLILLFFCLFIATPSSANQPKHILVLHSYHQSMGWVKNINQAIIDVLKPQQNNYVMHIENMDTKRIYTSEHLQHLKEIYRTKYKNIKLDLILSSDNNAFDFLRKNRDEIFGNVPVAFSGVNFFKQSDLEGYHNFTGAAEVFDAKTTIENALQLLPNTKQIYIINDYLKTGRAWEKSIKIQIENIDKNSIKNINIRYASNQSMAQLQETLSNLPKDSIVLLGVYFKDKKGEYFTYEKTGELLAQSSSVPVFCLLEFNLHYGVVGGSVIGGYYQGEAMSKIALQILAGTSADDIPVIQSGSTKLIYDYPSLIKHGIDIDEVDKNVLILNLPISYWQENKQILVVSFLIILLLIVAIIVLLIINKKRKNAEANYRHLSESLELNVSQRTIELRKLKERMELALIGNNDGLWDWEIETNKVYFSSRWKEMLGFNECELTNNLSTWKERVHPDDLPIVMRDIEDNIAGKTDFFENTHRLKHKEGHWVWILDRAKTLYNAKGQAIRMTGTHTDISEEKEKQLKFIHQAQMIEQTHDAVVSVDLNGFIVSWNLGAEKLLEYTAKEVIGKHIALFYRQQDHASLAVNMQTLLDKGELDLERVLIKKSQKLINVSISYSLLKDEKGQAVNMVGYIQDITERKQAENALKEQHQYLQTIIDGVDDPIIVINEDYTIELMNKPLSDTLNDRYADNTEQLKCYEVSHHRTTPCDGVEYPCPLRQVMESQKHMKVVHDHCHIEGSKNFVELSATPIFDKDNNCIGIIESSRDITAHIKVQDELREQKKELNFQATHDTLTGLPNRALFNDRLTQGIEKSKRYKTKLALLFIDLDHFKEINDSLGHDIGDEVLKVTAQRFQNAIRNEDTLARLGGDEFTIILEDLVHAQDASLLAKKLVDVIAKPMLIKKHSLYLSTSIGISLFPEDSDAALDLIKYADTAMYKAKDEGRNNFQYYSREMTELAFERVVMEASLRRALKNDEFVVYYQPQINGENNQLIGMEALVRWQHPEMGMVSPAKFIPLAESTGLIIKLDQLVMKKAMTQVSKWYAQGLNPGRLALNLAMKQLQQKDLVTIIENLISDTQCKAQWLELEVTEGEIMTHPEEAINTLNQISALGIKLAVDDFGTGYSSLSYLKKLPINKLKIDQSFVRDLPGNEEDEAIAKSVIALAQSLKLGVIAEGVETKEQKDFLVKNSCRDIQGYFYSKPMPACDMEVYLKKF